VRNSIFSDRTARNIILGMASVLFYATGAMYTCFVLMDQPGSAFGVNAIVFGGIGWAVVLKWHKEISWRLAGLALWVVIMVLVVGQLFVS
jgi:hypothetical protein